MLSRSTSKRERTFFSTQRARLHSVSGQDVSSLDLGSGLLDHDRPLRHLGAYVVGELLRRAADWLERERLQALAHVRSLQDLVQRDIEFLHDFGRGPGRREKTDPGVLLDFGIA